MKLSELATLVRYRRPGIDEIKDMLLNDTNPDMINAFNEIEDDKTILMHCIKPRPRNYLENFAIELVRRGRGNPEYVDADGNTALILACMHKNVNLAMELIHTLPGHANRQNRTALIYACISKMENVALALINTGRSNPFVEDVFGNTSVEYAEDNDLDEVYAALQRITGDEMEVEEVEIDPHAVHREAREIEENMPDIINKIKDIIGERVYDAANISREICGKLTDIININSRYSEPEKQTKRRELNDVCQRLIPVNIFDISPNMHTKMGYSVDYVTYQDDIFKQIYIDGYILDCRYAYPGQGVEALSCAGGMAERTYLVLLSTIKSRLALEDEFPLSSDKKREYRKIIGVGIFTIDFLLEQAREWKKENVSGSVSERKASLRNYLTEKLQTKARSLNVGIEDAEYKMLEEFLSHSFDEDGDLTFGGKRRGRALNKRKTKMKTKKAKKTKTQTKRTKR